MHSLVKICCKVPVPLPPGHRGLEDNLNQTYFDGRLRAFSWNGEAIGSGTPEQSTTTVWRHEKRPHVPFVETWVKRSTQAFETGFTERRGSGQSADVRFVGMGGSIRSRF